MASLTAIRSLQNENVFPMLLESLNFLKHRGNSSFLVSVGGETLVSSSLKKLAQKTVEGTVGMAFSSKGDVPVKSFFLDGEFFSLPPSTDLFNATPPQLKNFLLSSDGEFTLMQRKQNSFSVLRDLLGSKPLWFGSNSSFHAFSSEYAPLSILNIQFPSMLPPAHKLLLTSDGFKTQKIASWDDFKKTLPRKTSPALLTQSFKDAVKKRSMGLKKAGVFFSGGVDSTTVALELQNHVKEARLFSIGLPDSHDLQNSRDAAKELGLDLIEVEPDLKNLKNTVLETMKALGFFDEMQLQIGVPEFLLCKKAAELGFENVFTGQGSDEVFCGYSSFRSTLRSRGEKAVEQESWNCLANMWCRNLFRGDKISSHFGISLKAPFLDSEFLRNAMRFPVNEKILSPSDELRKRPLRGMALSLGVPKQIAFRKKKAIQYGSGLSKEVSRLLA